VKLDHRNQTAGDVVETLSWTTHWLHKAEARAKSEVE